MGTKRRYDDGSAGATLDPVDVEDGDGSRLKTDPAASGEVGQGLVDRLTGGAHELGELLLSQVVMNVDAVVTAVAKSLGEFEQLLRNPSGDIGEHHVGDDVIRPT